MTDSYYPDVDPVMLLPLRSIFDQMLNDPLWLDRPDCPYDDETREAVRELWVRFRVSPSIPTGPDRMQVTEAEDKFGALSTELTQLFDELRNFASNIPNEDTKERLAYFRTATSLLDKITSLAERIHNVKAVSDFTNKVIGVFDVLLAPEERTQAMEMLNK